MGDGARLPREVRAEHTPSTPAGGVEEIPPAAPHVQEAPVGRRVGSEHVETIQQGDEEFVALRVRLRRTEAARVLGLVVAPELDGGRRRGDDRALAA